LIQLHCGSVPLRPKQLSFILGREFSLSVGTTDVVWFYMDGEWSEFGVCDGLAVVNVNTTVHMKESQDSDKAVRKFYA
jgi:hypothetical protein